MIGESLFLGDFEKLYPRRDVGKETKILSIKGERKIMQNRYFIFKKLNNGT